jgi:tripartite-type tricarboxylate transporter receptor subunit TctC
MKVMALSSPKRAVSNPEIALIAETVPGFSAVSAIGIIGSAGLPPALLQKISADIGQVVRSAEVVARMQQLGMEPVGSTAAQYTAQIRQDIVQWAAIVKSAGIKLA